MTVRNIQKITRCLTMCFSLLLSISLAHALERPECKKWRTPEPVNTGVFYKRRLNPDTNELEVVTEIPVAIGWRFVGPTSQDIPDDGTALQTFEFDLFTGSYVPRNDYEGGRPDPKTHTIVRVTVTSYGVHSPTFHTAIAIDAGFPFDWPVPWAEPGLSQGIEFDYGRISEKPAPWPDLGLAQVRFLDRPLFPSHKGYDFFLERNEAGEDTGFMRCHKHFAVPNPHCSYWGVSWPFDYKVRVRRALMRFFPQAKAQAKEFVSCLTAPLPVDTQLDSWHYEYGEAANVINRINEWSARHGHDTQQE